MGKLINFTGVTRLDTPSERVIEALKEEELEGIVVMGYTKDGQTYFASSYADGGTVIWLIEQMKHELLTVDVD